MNSIEVRHTRKLDRGVSVITIMVVKIEENKVVWNDPAVLAHTKSGERRIESDSIYYPNDNYLDAMAKALSHQIYLKWRKRK